MFIRGFAHTFSVEVDSSMQGVELRYKSGLIGLERPWLKEWRWTQKAWC